MALTNVDQKVQLTRRDSSHKFKIYKHTFDNSYATGGLALLPADVGLTGIVAMWCVPSSGYTFEWLTNKLIARVSVAVYTGTLDVASRSTVSAGNESLTLTGVGATDQAVYVQAPAAFAAGLDIQSSVVSGANTVTVRNNNPTAGTLDGASGTFTGFIAAANGAMHEVPSATDLSTISTYSLILGY